MFNGVFQCLDTAEHPWIAPLLEDSSSQICFVQAMLIKLSAAELLNDDLLWRIFDRICDLSSR